MTRPPRPLAEIAFEGPVIEWRGPAPFYFVAIPEALVGEVRHAARVASYGWGCVPAEAAIGATRFTTSLMPRGDTYLLPLKSAVRREAGIGPRDAVRVTLRVVQPAVPSRGTRWPTIMMVGAALAAVTIPKRAIAGPRAREAGVIVGLLPPGPLNAITDVAGIKVGQVTIKRGKDIHTGVTAILAHGGNLFQDKVPAGFVAENAFGKFMGSTQVAELGEIETPILLTNTLNVAEAGAAAVEWTLAQPGNEEVRSVNAIVGETNDAQLNDIRGRHVTIADARRAIEIAKPGPVEEGVVGAGTGTVAFGWKGGIGTSSRRLPISLGGWTVGVLVQTNYGGALTIAGVPVGVRLGQYDFREQIEGHKGDGSVVIVVATDAPLSDRNLKRLAARTFAGIARTGSGFTNASGDYAVAFSTNLSVRRTPARRAATATVEDYPNDMMSPLFEAAEATEEAALDSMFTAHMVVGHLGTIPALSLDRVLPMVRAAMERPIN